VESCSFCQSVLSIPFPPFCMLHLAFPLDFSKKGLNGSPPSDQNNVQLLHILHLSFLPTASVSFFHPQQIFFHQANSSRFIHTQGIPPSSLLADTANCLAFVVMVRHLVGLPESQKVGPPLVASLFWKPLPNSSMSSPLDPLHLIWAWMHVDGCDVFRCLCKDEAMILCWIYYFSLYKLW